MVVGAFDRDLMKIMRRIHAAYMGFCGFRVLDSGFHFVQGFLRRRAAIKLM